MLEAFRELGYQVTAITGVLEERRRQAAALTTADLAEHRFCYSEPPAYPVHPVWDYLFYRRVQRVGVPLGLFYRDAYWKLGQGMYAPRGFKRWLLRLRYRSDLRLYQRTGRVIFFPSQTLANHFSLRIPKQVLWPATHRAYDPTTARSVPQTPFAVTFVGNISHASYGLGIMLEAMRLVNEWQHVVLNLVCPERNLKDQPNVLAPFRDRSWLRVQHIHGDALQPVYQTSCLGLVPRQRTTYNDLAMPVKLFEYLSHGLPVVVTNCTEMAHFVNQTGVGLVAQDNAESLAKTIRTILSDPALYRSMASAVRKAVETDHRWVDRARQVAETLAPITDHSDDQGPTYSE